MPVQTSYPGVYVQEVPSGVRTIAGVSTSVALFVGRTKWGPANFPVLCLNYTDFLRTFTDDTSQGDMARAVQLFFLNGGTKCYVTRIAGSGYATSTLSINGGATPTLIITAKNPGVLGDSIKAIITESPVPAASSKFTLELYRDVGGVKTDSQTWTGLSMDPTLSPTNLRYAPNFVNYKWAVLSAPAIINLVPPANTNVLTPLSLALGSDGGALALTDYDAAYLIIDKEVDLFNLMILPKDVGLLQRTLWNKASIFCQQRRAFLLMDPPYTSTAPVAAGWTDVTTATNSTIGVNTLRSSLIKDYSAVFFPNLTIDEGGPVQVGPSGAIAGLMARIDGTRGVWKAPAGTEADIRGISGLEYRFSDSENGVLNPHAVNTLRIFPNGIVNWGARTMDGDDDFASEYKYIPIRRTSLFIEESLYRGLKWVVFEPNDEPLWAQIRLNVGAFMHNLFRQGAFQGTKKQDAYFVKCDSETTTQNDINLGIVNIWVGFAPLKPAEFVVLYLQQMTGQIQV
jgi:phage tail sheath protein FI